MSVRAPGFAPTEVDLGARPAERRFDVAVALSPAPPGSEAGEGEAPPRTAVVAGVVVGPTNDPLPGARITAVPRDRPVGWQGPDRREVRTRADAAGRFSLRVEPGRHRLEVTAPGFQPADPRALDVAVEDGEETRALVVRLRQTDLLLMGVRAVRVVPAETFPAAVLCARAHGPYGVVLRWRLDVPPDIDPLVEPTAYRLLRAEAGETAAFRPVEAEVSATSETLAAAVDNNVRSGTTYLYRLETPAGDPAGPPVDLRAEASLPEGIPFLEPLGW